MHAKDLAGRRRAKGLIGKEIAVWPVFQLRPQPVRFCKSVFASGQRDGESQVPKAGLGAPGFREGPVEVRGFLPFRQKKGERTGHGDLPYSLFLTP